MISGIRKLGPATLRIRQNNDLPVKMREHIREIVELYVDPAYRGQGCATELMHKVCQEADHHSKVLMLIPGAFGEVPGMSTDDMITWYEKTFGFQVTQLTPVILMARMMGATPRQMELRPTMGAVVEASKIIQKVMAHE